MRNTKQKEIVKRNILNNITHPSIQEIYKECVKEDNTIGLATIYRNIDSMVERNEINKFTDNFNIIRYDPILKNHIHFQCELCKKIYDVDEDINKYISNKVSIGSVDTIKINYIGKCKKCIK